MALGTSFRLTWTGNLRYGFGWRVCWPANSTQYSRDKIFPALRSDGCRNKNLDVVVYILNRLWTAAWHSFLGRSGVRNLCDWPEARDTLSEASSLEWRRFTNFTLDWFIPVVKYSAWPGRLNSLFLFDRSAEKCRTLWGARCSAYLILLSMMGQTFWSRTTTTGACCLHRFSNPVPCFMVRLSRRCAGGRLAWNAPRQMLFWYVQSGMWGQVFSLHWKAWSIKIWILAKRRRSRQITSMNCAYAGGLRVEPGHFHSGVWGSRFVSCPLLLDQGWQRPRGLGRDSRSRENSVANELPWSHHIFPRLAL